MKELARELFAELDREFLRTAGVASFSPVGIHLLNDQIPWDPSDQNPDPRLFIGAGAPSDPDAEVHASWSKSDFEAALADDRWLATWLSHAWLALIAAKWEGHYRPSFSKLHGVDLNDVRSDVMGDIRHLRNDVIHNKANASNEHTARCRIITRFKPGDSIVLEPRDIWFLRSNLTVEIPVVNAKYSTSSVPRR